MKLINLIAGSALAAVLVAGSAAAGAGPVVVTEATSGSAGDWTYDFTYANHVGSGQYLYFLGVLDATGTNIATPSNFNTYPGAIVGPVTYNIAWLTPNYLGNFTDSIASGSLESGFEVRDTSIVPMNSFKFFGYTYDAGNIYMGGQNYGGQASSNPVFVGVTSASVPEPATWAMLVLGMGAIGAAMRRQRVAIEA